MSAADRWSSGDADERHVGRRNRRVATEFRDWLGVPPGCRWLDVGSGTAAAGPTSPVR